MLERQGYVDCLCSSQEIRFIRNHAIRLDANMGIAVLSSTNGSSNDKIIAIVRGSVTLP